MKEEIINIKNEAYAQITQAKDVNEIDNFKVAYLGRNGKINVLLKKIRNLSPEERKQTGILVNEVKKTIENLISQKHFELIKSKTEKRQWFDLTVPGIKPQIGTLHAQTQVLSRVKEIFKHLGYQITDGPEIESDYYNFEALNMPKDHPARDTQMTFYIDTYGTTVNFGELILRTQTSAMQARVMEKVKPPLKILVPGKCFRFDQVDASHGFEFWHVEGFVVDKNIHLTDVFGTIEYVLKQLFGSNLKIKFATTYFPFVEPGVDTYIECSLCKGKGCSFCKKIGWSEIMPAGMIHPFVLDNAGIDSKKWGGFAFAIGLSRIVNLKYQIKDLRVLTTPDLRILRQF